MDDFEISISNLDSMSHFYAINRPVLRSPEGDISLVSPLGAAYPLKGQLIWTAMLQIYT